MSSDAEGAARAARLCVGLLRAIQQAATLTRWVDTAEAVQASLAHTELVVHALQNAEEALSRVRASVEGASQRENVCASLLRQSDTAHALQNARAQGGRTAAVTLLLHNLITSISATAGACVKQLRPAPSAACVSGLDAETEAALRAAEEELSRALGTDGCVAEPPAAETRPETSTGLRPWTAASDAPHPGTPRNTPRESLRTPLANAQAHSQAQTHHFDEWEACVSPPTPRGAVPQLPIEPRPPYAGRARTNGQAGDQADGQAGRVPLRRLMHQVQSESPPPYLGEEAEAASAREERPLSSPLPIPVSSVAAQAASSLDRLDNARLVHPNARRAALPPAPLEPLTLVPLPAEANGLLDDLFARPASAIPRRLRAPPPGAREALASPPPEKLAALPHNLSLARLRASEEEEDQDYVDGLLDLKSFVRPRRLEFASRPGSAASLRPGSAAHLRPVVS